MFKQRRPPQRYAASLGLLLGGSLIALGQPGMATPVVILGMLAEIALALKMDRASRALTPRNEGCDQEGHSLPTLPLS